MNARDICTFLLSATLLCAVLLITYAYKRRSMPGAKYFILVLLSALIYNGTYIGEINSNNLNSAIFWYNIEHIAIPLQHYFWTMMSLEYSRLQKKKLKIAKYIMLYHPIMYYIIFYTNNIHHLYVSSYNFQSNGYFTVIITDKGILYMITVLSGTLLGLISTIFYIRGYMKAARLQRRGYIIMIIASLFPWVSVYLFASNKTYLGIDYYPVSTIISGILYLLGIFQFRILNTIPIAYETIFNQSKEGILLCDLNERIIEVNDAFLKIYPKIKILMMSKKYTLSLFIKNHPEFKSMDEGTLKLQYELETNGESKYYSAEITEILSEDNVRVGKILTISDVTLFMEYQKKLELIAHEAENRAETNEISFLQAQIKPHFLNNTLSVIASMVTRNPDAARDLIVNLSEYLMNCYSFDYTSGMELLKSELDTVNTYIAIEKARFRERLNFILICDNVPNFSIPRLALQPLVENAVRHGILKKAEGGKVCLKITYQENKINFEISDNGIGMSEEKIKALMSGEDTDQGIGILNINKRLNKYYGECLKIKSTEGGGTNVSFSIPYYLND